LAVIHVDEVFAAFIVAHSDTLDWEELASRVTLGRFALLDLSALLLLVHVPNF
jgi:hypothetical protein